MARKFNNSDPTANAAIRNADRDLKHRAEHHDRPRPIVQQFPDVFEGLIPADCKRVAFRARAMVGGDVWAIQEHHLVKARFELIDRPRDIGRSR